MTLVGGARSLLYGRPVGRLAAAYAEPTTREERLAFQLSLWNTQWATLRKEVPHYIQLSHERDLPDRFASWDEVLAAIPTVTRDDVQAKGDAMTSRARKADGVISTGGSTAQPVQLPYWSSQSGHTRYNRWVARGWFGLTPASRTFWLWGHSHLLGTGVRGWIRGRERRLRDRLVGSPRFSAYDLRPEALRRAAADIVDFRPDCVFGYSVALDLFARANQSSRRQLRDLGLTLVVATAESFPSPDSRSRLEDLFGCPVVMEYGAVETDLVAHEHPQSGYRTFWRTYFVEAESENPDRAGRSVRVTSLYPRCFPLVRYELGDELTLEDSADEVATSLDSFRSVIGRRNDYVPLSDGTIIHSELFSHALRDHAAIGAFQVVVDSRGRVEIHYVPANRTGDAEISDVPQRLGRVHPELARASLVEVRALQQTVAGKTPMVRRSEPGERPADRA